KALLLFNTIEVRNGSRTRALNEFTHRLVSSLDRDTIELLAKKHGLALKGQSPWLKAIVGGSDDHGGLNRGRTWTEFDLPRNRPATPNDVVDCIRARRTLPRGAHGGPITLAHAMLKLLYMGSRARSRAKGRRTLSLGGTTQSLLRFVFDSCSLSVREKAAFKLDLLVNRVLDRIAPGRTAHGTFEEVLAGQTRALLA